MIYVKRDSRGRIIALGGESFVIPEPERGDWHPAVGDEPDVVAFTHEISRAVNPLQSTDMGLVRVLEDLVELLVERSVIRFTDLPSAAQAKLLERRGTREAMHRSSLLDEDDDGII